MREDVCVRDKLHVGAWVCVCEKESATNVQECKCEREDVYKRVCKCVWEWQCCDRDSEYQRKSERDNTSANVCVRKEMWRGVCVMQYSLMI